MWTVNVSRTLARGWDKPGASSRSRRTPGYRKGEGAPAEIRGRGNPTAKGRWTRGGGRRSIPRTSSRRWSPTPSGISRWWTPRTRQSWKKPRSRRRRRKPRSRQRRRKPKTRRSRRRTPKTSGCRRAPAKSKMTLATP